MKKCKSCQSEIDDKAKKCPKCQADQRNWFARHPIWTGVFGLILLVIVVSAFSQGGNDSQKIGSTNESTNNSGESTEQAYKVGDKIQMGDVILTVNSQERSSGSQFNKPSEGNEWLDLNITVENTGSDQEFITTHGQVYIIDSEGNQYQVAITDKTLDNAGGSTSLDGALLAKAKKTGWVGFEIPKGKTDLKFQYNASFWDDKKIVVEL